MAWRSCTTRSLLDPTSTFFGSGGKGRVGLPASAWARQALGCAVLMQAGFVRVCCIECWSERIQFKRIQGFRLRGRAGRTSGIAASSLTFVPRNGHFWKTINGSFAN